MKTLLLTCLALALLAPSAFAICSLPGPGRPGPPTGPGNNPPTTPPPGIPGTPTPGIPGGPGAGTGRARPAAGPSFASSWNIWWELNREYIFGLRKTLEASAAVTGDEGAGAGSWRDRVRAALRKVALNAGEKDVLRATALRAWGRAGVDTDALEFLKILRSPQQPPIVREGAAIGLASLGPMRDDAIREEVRAFFEDLLRGRVTLSDRAELVAILTMGLRGRDDEGLAGSLAARIAREMDSTNEAAAYLFACGLTRRDAFTETLAKAATTGRIGRVKLSDIARAHCVLALAMCGGAQTGPALAKLLVARKVQVQTRRSTALAIGLLLREGTLDGVSDRNLQASLVHCFEKESDSLVKGYCAIAMGAAKKPFLMNVLVRLVDRTGSVDVKPYAALALGLTARTLGGRDAERIRKLLIDRLPEAKDLNLAASLTIAIGLAGAEDARDMLIERAASRKLIGPVRGSASQALGMLGGASPRIREMLEASLDEREREVVEDAALALGFFGQPGTGKLLVEKLIGTRSPAVQLHMVVALSHLGGTEAIDPLIAVLEDRSHKHPLRSSAASALGILLDPRERDPLFEIDAYANPYGLTEATREIVRVY